MGSTQTFTTAQRIEALTAAAEWCRQGAPGGAPNALFSDKGPCALGKVLLGLNPDWSALPWDDEPDKGLATAADVILGKHDTDYEDARVVRADKHVALTARCFDSGQFEQAAFCLEAVAELLEELELSPSPELEPGVLVTA